MKQTKLFLALFTFLLLTASVWAQARLSTIDLTTGTVVILNPSPNTIDISSHRLCFLFTYPVISSLTVIDGDPANMLPGAILILTGIPLNPDGSDLAIYTPTGDFTEPDNMLDFVQWGSAGNGRESVAVEKGIWAAGTFIEGPAPYFYIGNFLDEFGVEFWMSVTDVNEIELANEINLYPNPAIDELNIISEETSIESYKIVNMLGEIVYDQSLVVPQKEIKISLYSLKRGNYILYLNSSKGIATKKLTLIR